MNEDSDLRPRPGKIGETRSPRAKPFVAQALAAAEKAGGLRRGRSRSVSRRSNFGRGGAASLRAGLGLGRTARRVTVKARVVRHRSSSAPLSTHLGYLRREGVTRDGSPGRMFDRSDDDVDADAFAGRSRDDRHHFRFIVSPEDASELTDLRTFTRDLVATAESDLGTKLDWVAVDHWNTEHPHIHVLVRGRADDGEDLVVSRDYISRGFRMRAMERATLELGPRSDREVEQSLRHEMTAERWTSLDRALSRDTDQGIVDLRPRFGERLAAKQAIKVGRMRKLEALGLAAPLGPNRWEFAANAKTKLQGLQRHGDIIARLHDALGSNAVERGVANLVLDGGSNSSPVMGRLAARGLDDELSGSAFAVIDGTDGRTHHVELGDLDTASDAKIGAIVEIRWTQGTARAQARMFLAVRSDVPLDDQITSHGATWLDRQLVAQAPTPVADSGFGAEVREALAKRMHHHLASGNAEQHGQKVVVARKLLATLRRRELENALSRLTDESGLMHRPAADGERVSGVVRQRVTLASGRFAMIDDGTGFQLVPWSQALQQRLGQHVAGRMSETGRVEWTFDRHRGLSI